MLQDAHHVMRERERQREREREIYIYIYMCSPPSQDLPGKALY